MIGTATLPKKKPRGRRPRGETRGSLEPEGGNLLLQLLGAPFDILVIEGSVLDSGVSHFLADGSELGDRHAHREGLLDGGGVAGDELAGGFGNHWWLLVHLP